LKVNSRGEALRQRKNDEPFIPGLRNLQERLTGLADTHIDSSKISAVRIDQVAEVPDQRIKPKRKLIVMLPCLAG